MTLWDLDINHTALVATFVQTGASKNGLLPVFKDLGILKDSVIKCIQKSRFGGPRVYEVNGTTVCTLCKKGAEKIIISEEK